MFKNKDLRKAQRWRALAADGDGTLLRHGQMADATVKALQRLHDAGFQLILATGETRDEVETFPHLELFDCVVAENGGLLFWPGRHEKPLGPKPPEALVTMLKDAGAKPLHVGRVIVATEEPFDRALQKAIARLGIDYRIHRNRKEAMALPAGIDKGTGLEAAARELGLKLEEIVGVGDAENDRPMLTECGLGVAVHNALACVKPDAALVTHGGRGQGIVELVDQLLGKE